MEKMTNQEKDRIITITREFLNKTGGKTYTEVDIGEDGKDERFIIIVSCESSRLDLSECVSLEWMYRNWGNSPLCRHPELRDFGRALQASIAGNTYTESEKEALLSHLIDLVVWVLNLPSDISEGNIDLVTL